MHSLLPLSLFLFISSSLSFRFPVEVRTSHRETSNSLAKRSPIPLANNGNAQYITNITLGGTNARVMLDTGSSDLWVNFPGAVPSTTDLGKSLTLNYAIGAASGDIQTAPLTFGNLSVADQAFLLVTDASSFSSNIHAQGYDGLMGLGPNEGSVIYDKVDSAAGDTVLSRIFEAGNSTSNYITFLLNRNGDKGQTFTGEITVNEVLPAYTNITSMPQMDVETVLRLLDQQQHWQALTDKDNGIIGPDGAVIQYDSIVPKAPDGQLVVVFDSGFTFNQVPRSISDAIYGRVQNAVYDTTNEWWTVPCGQELNITINIGGTPYPIHPLDTVDSSYGIKNANGTTVCIGSFQPITTAFSILGNYDMIMGMSFLRNAYTLLNYGKWAAGSDDPYIQLLPVTYNTTTHADFVATRLGGVDTTGSSQYALLPATEEQHSPLSAEEKKKDYEEMILSRWPYIFVGCFVFVLILTSYIVWRCCCRKRCADRKAKKAAKAALDTKQMYADPTEESASYLPLQKKHDSGYSASQYPDYRKGGNAYGESTEQFGGYGEHVGYGNEQQVSYGGDQHYGGAHVSYGGGYEHNNAGYGGGYGQGYAHDSGYNYSGGHV